MLKKIDKLILKGFFPPFFMTFIVSSFVLVLQFFWKYIDDISGKGLGILTILELIGYLSIHLIPLALPLSVLISSVMLMGGFAERYELSSMKSAGMPLIRIMRPLIFICLAVSGISFLVANYAVPIANLKSKTKLKSIQKQKPTLALDAGAFNDDFMDYVVYIGNKSEDGRHLEKLMLYNHSDEKSTEDKIIAETGEMYTENNILNIIMRDGANYTMRENPQFSKKHPYIITSFSEYHKRFDLSEFNLEEEDEDNYKNRHNMMNVHQLHDATKDLKNNYYETVYNFNKKVKRQLASFDEVEISSTATIGKSFIESLPKNDSVVKLALKKAQATARSLKRHAEIQKTDATSYLYILARHEIEFHNKFSFALACMIFLFIGAPMGAIIRKGGFGWPLLVSVVFFMIFIILSSFGRELSEEYIIAPQIGTWIPIFVIFPIGLFLTYKAMNESSGFNIPFYLITDFFKKIFKKAD